METSMDGDLPYGDLPDGDHTDGDHTNGDHTDGDLMQTETTADETSADGDLTAGDLTDADRRRRRPDRHVVISQKARGKQIAGRYMQTNAYVDRRRHTRDMHRHMLAWSCAVLATTLH
jgi:hypothetical protein